MLVFKSTNPFNACKLMKRTALSLLRYEISICILNKACLCLHGLGFFSSNMFMNQNKSNADLICRQ